MSDDTIYIKSTGTNALLSEDGRTPAWSISVRNWGRRGLVALAHEGGREVTPMFSSFRLDLFGCRKVEIPLAGTRLTAKVKAQGTAAMIAKLVADGLAPADYELNESAVVAEAA